MTTVLVVDDHENVGLLDLLNEKGFATIQFNRGDEVIRALNETGIIYDVAVVDCALKRAGDSVDGNEVIKTLKRIYPTKPVICVSAYIGARSHTQVDRYWDLSNGAEGLVAVIEDCAHGKS